MSSLITIYYFSDGALNQVCPELARNSIDRKEARLATNSETRSYLRQIALSDAGELTWEDMAMGGDSGPSQPSYDY